MRLTRSAAATHFTSVDLRGWSEQGVCMFLERGAAEPKVLVGGGKFFWTHSGLGLGWPAKFLPDPIPPQYSVSYQGKVPLRVAEHIDREVDMGSGRSTFDPGGLRRGPALAPPPRPAKRARDCVGWGSGWRPVVSLERTEIPH